MMGKLGICGEKVVIKDGVLMIVVVVVARVSRQGRV